MKETVSTPRQLYINQISTRPVYSDEDIRQIRLKNLHIRAIAPEKKEKQDTKQAPTIEDMAKKYHFEVLQQSINVDIDDIKINTEYQRARELNRLKKLIKAINAGGYWHHIPIQLNDKMGVIDGQHRFWAAKTCGIEFLLCTVLKFETKIDEIRYFVETNNWRTSLSVYDHWKQKYASNDFLALLLYRLNDDVESPLYKKIGLGHNKMNSRYLTIYQVIMAINLIHHDLTWRKSYSPLVNKYNEDYLAECVSRISYEQSRQRMADFVYWMEKCFGMKGNNPAYVTKNYWTICCFYRLCSKQNIKFSRTEFSKMKKYEFHPRLNSLNPTGRVYDLIAFFNKGRQEKNRMDYEEVDV